MKPLRVITVLVLVLSLTLGVAQTTHARVMLTTAINQFQFDVLPTATFTVDDWLSNPNLWTLTILSDKTITYMRIDVSISTPAYGQVAEARVTVIGNNGFEQELLGGVPFYLNNTMVQDGKAQVVGGEWSDEFVDEVLKTGYLPEGWYTLRFAVIDGRYADGTSFSGDQDLPIEEYEIEIRNPLPPELMTPADGTNDVTRIPRFTWLRPEVSNLSQINGVMVDVNYTVTLWRMFEIQQNDVRDLNEEEAIDKDYIWRVEGLRTEAVDFDPGSLRFVDELEVGRKYCWQVQAFDGLGRPISPKNEGKSDVWEFTVQFEAPELNPPDFGSLSVTWSPAMAGGAMVLYRIRIADNPEFISAYVQEGIMGTSFTYPGEAPALVHGTTYYLELQTTNQEFLPIGDPDMITFTLPPLEANVQSPADGTAIPGTTPVFTWSGNSTYYTVRVWSDISDWSYRSPAVRGTRWVYTGEPLARGGSYRWFVTPADQYGERIGTASRTAGFTVPGENQNTIISPVNEMIDTVFPVFTWDAAPDAPANTRYSLTLTDVDGNIIHTADVTGTSYAYPQDAEGLLYGAKYWWSVTSDMAGAEESSQAWFATPFVFPEGDVLSLEDMQRAIMIVLSDYPEYSRFEGKVLRQIMDETGPLTPNQLMEILDSFKIVSVETE